MTAEIIENQRQSLKNFMQKHKLNANAWAKKAGIAEATIRHYLSGRNHSLTSVNLELLANAAGVNSADIISVEAEKDKDHNLKTFKPKLTLEIQRDLFIHAFEEFERLSLDNKDASAKERANAILSWYQLIQEKYLSDKVSYKDILYPKAV